MMDELVLRLVLADDDDDDCLFFKDALTRLPVATRLTRVEDGEHLMQLLTSSSAPLPFAIFLDLNMPRKNGHECLAELKKHQRLQQVPVVVLSTSSEPGVIDQLFRAGAAHYIAKPSDFFQLTSVIQQALDRLATGAQTAPERQQFVIEPLVTARPV